MYFQRVSIRGGGGVRYLKNLTKISSFLIYAVFETFKPSCKKMCTPIDMYCMKRGVGLYFTYTFAHLHLHVSRPKIDPDTNYLNPPLSNMTRNFNLPICSPVSFL